MGKIINGVPNWAVYAGGAFAVYWFFFRGETFGEPILGVVRAKTERERYLQTRLRVGAGRGRLVGSEWERVDPEGRRIT